VGRAAAYGGEGGATNGRIRAGERLTRALVVSTRRKGTLTGAIGYIQNLGPGGAEFANPLPGSGGSLLVGRFSFAIHISNDRSPIASS
jgi:hypothetical protein